MSEAAYPRPERIHAGTEGGLPLREVLAILRRRRRVIFWATALVTTVAVLIGLQVTRTYTATAQVMIEPRESRIVSAEKVAPGLPAEDSAIIETHIKLIQSRATLARAVDNLEPRVRSPARPERGGARPRRWADRWALLAGMAARLDRPSAAGALGHGGRHHDRRRTRVRSRDAARAGGRRAAGQPQGRAVGALLHPVDQLQQYRCRQRAAQRSPMRFRRVVYIDAQIAHKLSTTRRASSWLGKDEVAELRRKA